MEQLINFNVILTFKSPAWDEKNGIIFENIFAVNKRDAIKQARDKAYHAGHTVGRGKHWFRAEVRE